MNCTHYNIIHCIIEILTAIGTVGAVIVSLCLAAKNTRRRINAIFVCGAPTTDQPVLLIQNTGELDVVLDHIDVFYNKTSIGTISFLDDPSFSNYAIIKAKETKTLLLPTTVLHEPEKEGKKKKVMKLIIFQRHGRKCVTKEIMTDEEMLKLCFCCGLTKNNH